MLLSVDTLWPHTSTVRAVLKIMYTRTVCMYLSTYLFTYLPTYLPPTYLPIYFSIYLYLSMYPMYSIWYTHKNIFLNMKLYLCLIQPFSTWSKTIHPMRTILPHKPQLRGAVSSNAFSGSFPKKSPPRENSVVMLRDAMTGGMERKKRTDSHTSLDITGYMVVWGLNFYPSLWEMIGFFSPTSAKWGQPPWWLKVIL